MKLLDETIEYLKEKGIDPEKEVKWVGSRDGEYAMSFADFTKKFVGLYYDADFGRQEIAEDLVVVGDGWWLERAKYDGAEWWELKKAPALSPTPKNFEDVRNGDNGSTLAEINKDNIKQETVKSPLIKDEKVRKAVRAWAEANREEHIKVRGACLVIEFTGLHTQLKLELSGSWTRDGAYAVEELCGEEND